MAEAAQIDPFVFRISIFVLAIFVGYYVVWSVTPALHTPLMSVTNAISSVIVVGALLAVAVEAGEGIGLSKWLGFAALTLASVNIFGGFLVTQRMLAMYKKKAETGVGESCPPISPRSPISSPGRSSSSPCGGSRRLRPPGGATSSA